MVGQRYEQFFISMIRYGEFIIVIPLLPQYVGCDAQIKQAMVLRRMWYTGNGFAFCDTPGVFVGENAVVEDSVVMSGAVIKDGARLYRAIVASDVIIEERGKSRR